MAMVHVNGRTMALDGSSRVPSLAHMDNIGVEDRIYGYRAATVPSTPAVLGYLHLRYGRLHWQTILDPAIRLAREGYLITPLQHNLQKRELKAFQEVQSLSGAKYCLKKEGVPYEPGELFVQSELADVLETLSDEGPRAFYLGKIAQRIGEDMVAHGGFLRADDLALIPWPIERQPIQSNYRNVVVKTMPPPAAGRTLLLVLLMLNCLPPEFISLINPLSSHFLAEIFRKALLQRQQHPVDPNFYPQTPDKIMLNPHFAHELVRSIRDTVDPKLPVVEPKTSGGETTHLSVMDQEGNVVGLSQSIESLYGSKAVAEGLGFIYNNYIKTLETKDPSHPYYLRPNAVPWSSVAPAILFYKGSPWLVLGSPGSERIFTAIAQFLMHVIDGNLSMNEAMEHPRLHCSMGGKVSLESDRFDPTIPKHLEEIGYTIERRSPYSFYLGAIYAAMKCFNGKEYQGVAEIRREGLAGGHS
jgi:gamma-glutamyltranspeptidase/glutathione hydrolase